MDPSSNVLGRLLPAGSRLIASLRDLIVVRLPADAAYQQVAVIWDRSRDEQVLDCITALTYRDPQVRSRIIGLRMERGVLTCWYASAANLETDRNVIQLACDAALSAPAKRWVVASLAAVPIDAHRDRRILDRGKLAEGHPLLQIPPQYQLGVIGSTKDGARRAGVL